MFELPVLKFFLICCHSLPVPASLFLQNLCLKQFVISFVTAVHGFFITNPSHQGLRLKMTKSTVQAQTVPRFQQMRLKLMAQKKSLLVDKC